MLFPPIYQIPSSSSLLPRGHTCTFFYLYNFSFSANAITAPLPLLISSTTAVSILERVLLLCSVTIGRLFEKTHFWGCPYFSLILHHIHHWLFSGVHRTSVLCVLNSYSLPVTVSQFQSPSCSLQINISQLQSPSYNALVVIVSQFGLPVTAQSPSYNLQSPSYSLQI